MFETISICVAKDENGAVVEEERDGLDECINTLNVMYEHECGTFEGDGVSARDRARAIVGGSAVVILPWCECAAVCAFL